MADFANIMSLEDFRSSLDKPGKMREEKKYSILHEIHSVGYFCRTTLVGTVVSVVLLLSENDRKG